MGFGKRCFVCFVRMVLRTEPQILSVLGKSSFRGPTLPALVSVIHPFLSFEFGPFGGLRNKNTEVLV